MSRQQKMHLKQKLRIVLRVVLRVIPRLPHGAHNERTLIGNMDQRTDTHGLALPSVERTGDRVQDARCPERWVR